MRVLSAMGFRMEPESLRLCPNTARRRSADLFAKAISRMAGLSVRAVPFSWARSRFPQRRHAEQSTDDPAGMWAKLRGTRVQRARSLVPSQLSFSGAAPWSRQMKEYLAPVIRLTPIHTRAPGKTGHSRTWRISILLTRRVLESVILAVCERKSVASDSLHTVAKSARGNRGSHGDPRAAAVGGRCRHR